MCNNNMPCEKKFLHSVHVLLAAHSSLCQKVSSFLCYDKIFCDNRWYVRRREHGPIVKTPGAAVMLWLIQVTAFPEEEEDWG